MIRTDFRKLINCKTPEEVQRAVREWSSDRSEQGHLIRSSILDMHTNIEISLKQLLYQHMLTILFQDGNQIDDQKRREALENTIVDMNFNTVYRILKPCLEAFPREELKFIGDVNSVRNQATHRPIDKVTYKGKNPFTDDNSLAELFVDSWAITKCLSDFYEKNIEDTQALAKFYKEYYEKNYKAVTPSKRQNNDTENDTI
jgi:hypothetical protein